MTQRFSKTLILSSLLIFGCFFFSPQRATAALTGTNVTKICEERNQPEATEALRQSCAKHDELFSKLQLITDEETANNPAKRIEKNGYIAAYNASGVDILKESLKIEQQSTTPNQARIDALKKAIADRGAVAEDLTNLANEKSESNEDVCGITNLLACVPSVILDTLDLLGVQLVSIITTAAEKVFSFALEKSVSDFGSYANIPSIITIWKYVRDLFNLAFIAGLIYIAYATILNLKDFQWERMLVYIIIAALLVNFSFLISRTIIDVSNVISTALYNQMNGPSQPESVTTRIVKNTGILCYKTASGNPGTCAATTEPSGFGAKLATVAGKTVSLLLLAFVFLATSLFLVARAVILVILIATSPLAFGRLIFPKYLGTWSDGWWKYLGSQTLFLPVYLLMLYITVSLIDSSAGTSLNTVIGQGGATGTIIYFIIVIGLMFGSLYVAVRVGTAGGTVAGNIAGNAAGYFPRKYIGGFARRMANNKNNRLNRTGKWLQRVNVPGLKTISRGLGSGIQGLDAGIKKNILQPVATSKFGTSRTLDESIKRTTEIGKQYKTKEEIRGYAKGLTYDERTAYYQSLTKQQLKDQEGFFDTEIQAANAKVTKIKADLAKAIEDKKAKDKALDDLTTQAKGRAMTPEETAQYRALVEESRKIHDDQGSIESELKKSQAKLDSLNKEKATIKANIDAASKSKEKPKEDKDKKEDKREEEKKERKEQMEAFSKNLKALGDLTDAVQRNTAVKELMNKEMKPKDIIELDGETLTLTHVMDNLDEDMLEELFGNRKNISGATFTKIAKHIQDTGTNSELKKWLKEDLSPTAKFLRRKAASNY